jgi:putative transposase
MTAQRQGTWDLGCAEAAVPDFRFPIRDRAGQFAASFGAVLADAGIQAVKIPPRSPRANAYAERFVLTARTEVTDRTLIFGERHRQQALAHYNGRRPHRSRQLHPPVPDHPVADLSQMRAKHRPALGGLLNEYERAK